MAEKYHVRVSLDFHFEVEAETHQHAQHIARIKNAWTAPMSLLQGESVRPYKVTFETFNGDQWKDVKDRPDYAHEEETTEGSQGSTRTP